MEYRFHRFSFLALRSCRAYTRRRSEEEINQVHVTYTPATFAGICGEEEWKY